jgi:hypothetical protein
MLEMVQVSGIWINTRLTPFESIKRLSSDDRVCQECQRIARA